MNEACALGYNSPSPFNLKKPTSGSAMEKEQQNHGQTKAFLEHVCQELPCETTAVDPWLRKTLSISHEHKHSHTCSSIISTRNPRCKLLPLDASWSKASWYRWSLRILILFSRILIALTAGKRNNHQTMKGSSPSRCDMSLWNKSARCSKENRKGSRLRR